MAASAMSASLLAAAKLTDQDGSPADAEVMLNDLYDRLTSEPLLAPPPIEYRVRHA
jgi:hypothetical protein